MSEQQQRKRGNIARRVEELEDYCSPWPSNDELTLEGLRERIAGIPPDAVHESTFFCLACSNETATSGMIECLLDAFPDAIRSTSASGRSPLRCACWNRKTSLAILDLLLAAAPLSATIADDDGHLPIHVAIDVRKSYPFCKRLVDAYPESVRVQDGDGLLPIHLACHEGDIETVKYLFELYPESIDARDGEGNFPIHCAAYSYEQDKAAVVGAHKSDVIRYLLAKDPGCVSKTDGDQSLPLHVACWNNSFDSVRVLFDAYPEAINIRDGRGRTPVELARLAKRRRGDDAQRWLIFDDAVVEFLEEQLAYACLAERETHDGWLLLHALRNGACLGAIKLLIAGNPGALRVSANQLSPLHIACEYSTVDVVNCLLDCGVPVVSEPNSDGKLPIHLLWESDRVDRNSVDYVEAVWRLLLAHPETVMH